VDQFLIVAYSTRNSRERYVCVEPGHVRGFAKISPGRKWSGQQILTVI